MIFTEVTTIIVVGSINALRWTVSVLFYDSLIRFLGTNVTQTTSVSDAPAQPGGFSSEFKIGMTVAYVVIFLVALVGNSFGLAVVLRKSSSSSITNLFIANMAVADLLLTFTVMPFSVAYFYRDTRWIGGTMGNITCKVFFYSIPVSIAATVFTMVFISVERFYAIFYPLKEKVFRKPKVLSAVIWISSTVLMIPYVVLYRAEYFPGESGYFCTQVWPWEDPNDPTFAETLRVLKIFHSVVFVMLYAFPLLTTMIVYSLICRKLWLRKIPGNVTDRNRAAAEKSKRKVVRLLVIICVVFALCWFPVYVAHYFWYVRRDLEHLLPVESQFFFSWLAHANSAINPCLYILLNSKFRKELFTMLACCPCFRHYLRRASRSSTDNDNNLNNTSTSMWRLVSRGRSSAYTLPRSPRDKERGLTNLSLSWMSVKDDKSPPNSPPSKTTRGDSTVAITSDGSNDVAM